MTHKPTESSGTEFDDEITSFFDGAHAAEQARGEADSLELERIALITGYLKGSDSMPACLSYPDGSINQVAIELIQSGQLDGVPSNLDINDVIKKEKSLYRAMLELFDASDDFEDERFSIVGEGKKQLIAIWMNMRGLPFSSNWVNFLREILPGGDVSEADIDKKTEEIIEGNKVVAKVIEEIAMKFEADYGSSVHIDGAAIRERANRYYKLALDIVYNLMSSASISKGELDYRFAQLQMDFNISEATQLECFGLCAKLCDVDLKKAE